MKLSQLSARLSSAAALLASALCPVWMPETNGQECACQTQVSPSSVTAFVPQVPFGPLVPGMPQGQAPRAGFAGPQPLTGQRNLAQGNRLPAGWPAQWGDPIVAVPGKTNGQKPATRANANEGLVRDPFTGQMVPTSLQARWDKATTTRNTTTDPATEVKTKEEAKSVMVAEKSTDKSEMSGKADKSASGSSSKKAKSSSGGGGGGAPGGAFGAGVGMGGGGNGGGMGGGMAGGGNGGGGGNGTNGINWNPQAGGAGNAGGGGGNNNERTANAVLNENINTGPTGGGPTGGGPTGGGPTGGGPTGGGPTGGGPTGGGPTGGGPTGGGATGGGATGGGATGGGPTGGGTDGGGCLIDVNPPTPSVPPCDHGGHGSSPGNGPDGNVPPGTGGTDPGSPVVPEPGTALLLGIGGAIAGVRYLRRRNATEPAAV